MAKNEIIIAELQDKIDAQNELIEALRAEILELRAARPAQGGRKLEVLTVLREGAVSIAEIAERLNTTSKNVSSTLTFLRKEGAEIVTDSRGRKILIDESDEMRATYPRVRTAEAESPTADADEQA